MVAVSSQSQKVTPPAFTPEVWAEARSKLKPHGDAAMLKVDARSWHPTVE